MDTITPPSVREDVLSHDEKEHRGKLFDMSHPCQVSMFVLC